MLPALLAASAITGVAFAGPALADIPRRPCAIDRPYPDRSWVAPNVFTDDRDHFEDLSTWQEHWEDWVAQQEYWWNTFITRFLPHTDDRDTPTPPPLPTRRHSCPPRNETFPPNHFQPPLHPTRENSTPSGDPIIGWNSTPSEAPITTWNPKISWNPKPRERPKTGEELKIGGKSGTGENLGTSKKPWTGENQETGRNQGTGKNRGSGENLGIGEKRGNRERPGTAKESEPGPRPANSPKPAKPQPAHNQKPGEIAVAAVKSWLGTPYTWGGGNDKGPSRGIGRGAARVGFDCSGLVLAAWAKAGVDLAHYTGTQIRQGHPVAIKDLRPGDLMFFGGTPTDPTHVGMYIGQGTMIHAPKTGDVVRKVNVLNSKHYMSTFQGATRPTPKAPTPKK
ncbi:NlpC/P60 family protein [Acrocarpospora sp. B8E8]|uniref:C40 family peptidase n=1 Tax=Acrocarpospora sp. B8E8 TaxID=3153572 RepID=UPI00325E66F6